MNKYISIFLFLISIGSISSIGEEMKIDKKYTKYEDVSMIQLITNPAKYNGKQISVIGFTVVTPVSAIIHPSHIDYKDSIRHNMVILVLDRIPKRPGYIMQKNDKIQRQYSRIKGTFNSDNKYRNLTYAGKIENITSFDVWDCKFDSK